MAQLNAKVAELNDLLRTKLDNSMMVMELAKPEFLQQYRNARRNYALGVRHEQPEADTISTDDVANDKTNTVAKTIPAPDETAKLYTAL